MYVIVAALKAVIGDRTDALMGQSSELTRIEVKSAVDQAKKGEGHAPELTLSLMSTRSDIKSKEEMGSVRGLISEMRALVTNLRTHSDQSHRRAIELAIAEQAMGKLQKASAEQLKAVAALERWVRRLDARVEAKFYQRDESIPSYDECSSRVLQTATADICT